MADFIDCCGLSCPLPVIRVKKVLQEGGVDELKVLVDSPAARDNVTRMAESMGWKITATETDKGFLLIIEAAKG